MKTINLPRANEAEAACLGAVMLNPLALEAIRALPLDVNDFADARHQFVFQAMLDLALTGTPSDLALLRNELERRGLLERIGISYLSGLLDCASQACNVLHYAGRVKEASRKRALVFIGQELIAPSGTSEEVVSDVSRRLDILRIGGEDKRAIQIKDGVNALPLDGSASTQYIGTGLERWDALVGGIALGEFLCIGAWSGHGKSALLSQFALHAAMMADPVPVVIFSLEMPERALLERLLAATGKVSLSRLRRGQLEEKEKRRLAEHKAVLETAPIFVRDGIASVEEIIVETRRLVREHGIKVVVVDYLQLVRSDAPERRLQLEDIAQRLLGLAVETGVAILAASQLRKSMQSHESKPTMHDLRESGALFEAPHVVALLYRPKLGQRERCPECGGSQRDDCRSCFGAPGRNLDTVADIAIAKNRNGPTGYFELAWRGETLHLADISMAEAGAAGDEIEHRPPQSPPKRPAAPPEPVPCYGETIPEIGDNDPIPF